MPDTDRERDLERFITFIDAIVAIAITLLVLPLVELTADVEEFDTVADLLREHQTQIWAFLLSFVVIARLWFVQHESVRHVIRYHRRVAQLLMVWVLTIVFLPFPTALVATSGSSALTKVLYLGSMVVSTAVLTVLEAFLVLHPELTDGADDADPVAGVTNVVLLLAALAISVAVPAASYFPLLLLLVATPAANGWRRLRGRGPRPSRVGE
ncbi:TMEM175 family protein [Nocardioides sp. URHA0020]|uniref:TMEM175 family protein n=1 Tax=Nocardioides sp. URHA0020 TaxID=1380392 RepID=UPI0006857FB0|nr:TMEM175 family protein [Nocardioides sp. URHA0020]